MNNKKNGIKSIMDWLSKRKDKINKICGVKLIVSIKNK